MKPQRMLVLGGTGKTGSRVAATLRDSKQDVAIGSRTQRGAGLIEFDWGRPECFDAACVGVRAVYLVAPLGELNPAPVMQSFIEIALEAGVIRFVLLSSSLLEEDGPAMGAVHGFLRRNVPEWTVLRPSWFMQNFSASPHQATIRDQGRIISATGDGAVAFIDVADIANVAVRALTDAVPHNTAHLLTGPEALSYAEAASIIASVCGHDVRHENISNEQLAQRWSAFGLPSDYARMMAQLDEAISKGAENRVTSTVKDVTGRAPANFADFARSNAKAWRL
jgi:ergot alkaloid biosynthesis protein